MSKTKLLYAEQIRNELYNNPIMRDVSIDFRDIFLEMDNLVNSYAKAGFFENWKLGFGKVDDLWITDFANIVVTDPTNGNSYFTLPTSNYVTLPNGQGINDIYFMNNVGIKKRYYKPVIIKNYKDIAGYHSSLAGNNEGRISCAVKNRIVYFDRGKINQIYGQVGIRLVLRDSSMLQDNDVYPVPAEYEDVIVKKCVEFFLQKRMNTPDLIRDGNDKQLGK